MTENQDLHTIINGRVQKLIGGCQSVYLTTLNNDGSPDIGYLPFVYHNNTVFVYTSHMAQHGKNLMAGNDCKIMFIENERDAKTLLARKRVIFTAKQDIIDKFSPLGDTILSIFNQTVDSMYTGLWEMADFSLYQLDLYQGKFVQGFAQTFQHNTNGEWTKYLGVGHTKK